MDKHSISAAEFADKYSKGDLSEAEIVDVRELYEWEAYHLKHAKHIPMNTIPEYMSELPRNKPIYLLCAHGVRSWHVTSYLLGQGWNNVVNVEGGMAEVYPYVNMNNREV